MTETAGHDKLHVMEPRNLAVRDNLSKERVRTGGHSQTEWLEKWKPLRIC